MSLFPRLAGGVFLILGLASSLPATAQEPAATSVPTAEQLRIETEFRQGLQAVAAGDYVGAIAVFDAILVRDPGLIRVRLELARALFLAGDQDERARFQFERVMSADLPQAVQDNIGKFLSAIRKRRLWTLSAEFAIVPDSNINGGAESREVNLGGLSYYLNESSVKKSGTGLLTAVRGTYRFADEGRWRIQTGGGLTQRSYEDSEYDDTILNFSAGPRYLLDRGEIGFGLSGYYRWYGLDPYALFMGVQVDGNYLLSKQVKFEAALRLGLVTSQADPGREGASSDGSITLRYAVRPDLLLYGSLDARRDAFDNDLLANDGAGVSVGVYGDLPWGFSAGASARLGKTWFEGFSDFFQTTRRDDNRQYGFSLLNRSLIFWQTTPSFRYTHVENASNIDIYTYDRDIFQIGLTKEF